MENNFFTPDIERGNYERVVAVLSAQMNTTPEQFKRNYKIMPSVLKLAKVLDPGLSAYSLSPRKAVDPAVPGTVLLDQNDFFAIAGVGLRIGRAAYANGVYSNHGNYPLLTYADPAYFSGTGTSAGSEANSLQCLVNGTVSISVNNDAMVDPIVAQEFFYNPEGTYTSSPAAMPRFGGSDGDRGIFPITPQIILDASADNSILLSLTPGAKGNIDGSVSSGTTDSGTRNIVYALVYGWKIKNLAGSNASRCSV